MTERPDLSQLTHEEKDALIRALWAQVQVLTVRVAELEAKLGAPPKTPNTSSLPPSRGKKPNRLEKSKRHGQRPGSLGRMGGGRALTATRDEIVSAKPVRCAHCQAVLGEADHVLHGRYDKIDLPQVAPVVTQVERYAGHCRCCSAQQGHAEDWQICLAHQLRDCTYAIEAGDGVFARRIRNDAWVLSEACLG